MPCDQEGRKPEEAAALFDSRIAPVVIFRLQEEVKKLREENEAQRKEKEQHQLKAASELLEILKPLFPDDDGDFQELRRNETAIATIARLDPEVFKLKYKFDCWEYEVYPLGVLCVLQAPFPVLELVLDIYPEAAAEALQMCCGWFFDELFPIVEWLVEKRPEAPREPRPFDQILALHSACSHSHANLAMLAKYIFRKYPEAIKAADKDGCLPIHYACQFANLEVVKYLREQYPESISAACKKGYWPIHDACQFSNLEVIEYLLEQNPDSISEVDKVDKNETPFLLSLVNNDLSVARHLTHKYPDLVKRKDGDDDWLPLHYACKFSEEQSLIELLLQHYPDAVQIKDRTGNLPRDLAKENEHLGADLLEMLAPVSSSDATTATEDGKSLEISAVEVPLDMEMPLSDDTLQTASKRRRIN